MFGRKQGNQVQLLMEPKATWAIPMRCAHAILALTPIAATFRLGLATQLESLGVSDRIGFLAKCAAVISRDRYSILIQDGRAWGSGWSMETLQVTRWVTLHR